MAVGLGIEASLRVARGGGNVKRARRLLDKAQELAALSGNHNVRGLIQVMRGYFDYLVCDIPQGLMNCRAGIAYLREHCTGVAWELTAGYVLLFWFVCWSGKVGEVRDLLPQLLKDGAARGDVNVEVSLRLLSYVHYSYLCLDQAEQCILECERALQRWSHRGYHLQHYGGMLAIVESYLYLGQYKTAHSRLLEDWEPMRRSFILQWQTLRVMVFFLRGRVALACWLDDPRDMELRAEIEDAAQRLERIGSAWCLPMICALKAGLAAGEGRLVYSGQLLEKAADAFETLSLHAYASACRYVRGHMIPNEQGRSLITAATEFAKLINAVDPRAFLRTLLPGEWPGIAERVRL
jgi:hypothetical protein